MDPFPTPAQRAFIRRIRSEAMHIIRMENCMDINVIHPLNSGEYRTGTRYVTSVIADALQCRLQRFSGRNRSHQNQDMFVADRHLDIVAENDLPRRGILRAQHKDLCAL